MKKVLTKLMVKQMEWKMRTKESLQDERGQGMVEYGLIIALVAVVVIGALTLMGQGILGKFTEITNNL